MIRNSKSKAGKDFKARPGSGSGGNKFFYLDWARPKIIVRVCDELGLDTRFLGSIHPDRPWGRVEGVQVYPFLVRALADHPN